MKKWEEELDVKLYSMLLTHEMFLSDKISASKMRKEKNEVIRFVRELLKKQKEKRK